RAGLAGGGGQGRPLGADHDQRQAGAGDGGQEEAVHSHVASRLSTGVGPGGGVRPGPVPVGPTPSGPPAAAVVPPPGGGWARPPPWSCDRRARRRRCPCPRRPGARRRPADAAGARGADRAGRASCAKDEVRSTKDERRQAALAVWVRTLYFVLRTSKEAGDG